MFTENIFFIFTVSQSQGKLKEHILVPFLPVNPELSTMRNQGRQKLARLNKEEFGTLVWDILSDCKRRQSPFSKFVIMFIALETGMNRMYKLLLYKYAEKLQKIYSYFN